MRRALLLLLLAGCGGDTTYLTVVVPPPGFPPPPDAGVDAGAPDSGQGEDAGAPDAGVTDAGPADSGVADAGHDAGVVDAGQPDSGVVDAGTPDAGPVDAGFDAGTPDAGPVDAGTPDAGSSPCQWPMYPTQVLDGGFDASCVDWNPWSSTSPGYSYGSCLVLDDNRYNNRWPIVFAARNTAHQGPPDALQIHGFFDGWWHDPRNGRVFLPPGTTCVDDLFILDPPWAYQQPGIYTLLFIPSRIPATVCTGACTVVITDFGYGKPLSGTYSCYDGGTWAAAPGGQAVCR